MALARNCFINGSGRRTSFSESTNTEPGAVATGSNTKLGLILLHFLRRSESYVESMTPVATAPGSVFVDPRLNTVSLPDRACHRGLFCPNAPLQYFLACATLRASPRVECAAGYTTNVHRACKPGCDDRTQAEYSEQHNQVEQQIFQTLYFSRRAF